MIILNIFSKCFIVICYLICYVMLSIIQFLKNVSTDICKNNLEMMKNIEIEPNKTVEKVNRICKK